MGHDAKLNPKSGEYVGPNEVLDARGRPLQEGDEVIVVLNGPTYMRVTKITPSLHPQAPPGLMLITVGASYAFQTMRGQPNTEFVRVQMAAEAGALRGADLQSAPPAPPDSGSSLRIVEKEES